MEQQIKDIVAEYIKVPAGEITEMTVIDRSKVSSSIVLHRLYAKLAEEGYKVENYWNIKTFGNLLQQNNLTTAVNGSGINGAIFTAPATVDIGESSVGIDIEQVSAMPLTNDFREHAFYKMNFSTKEIAYCILQPDAYASFCGLYAAKEALVKAGNNFKNISFSSIIIDHSNTGKPLYPGYQLSISHTSELAVAVAVKLDLPQPVVSTVANNISGGTVQPDLSSFKFLAVAGFVIALISIVLLIINKF